MKKYNYSFLLPEILFDDEWDPTDEFLLWIEKYDPTEHNLMDFINTIFTNWNHGKYGYKLKRSYKGKCVLELHTLGCSANESIVDALSRNRYFFLMYWRKTECGGHYYFSIPIVDLK